MLLSINSYMLWILLIILSLTCGMFGSFNLNCKSRNEKKRRNIQTSILPSRRWLGDGEIKRRLMGKRYTLGGENAPGGLYWFLPLKRFIMYVIYLCILFLYNINQSSEVDAQNSVHIKQFVLSNIYSFNTERGVWDKQKKHMWFERMNTKYIGI